MGGSFDRTYEGLKRELTDLGTNGHVQTFDRTYEGLKRSGAAGPRQGR